MLRFLRLDLIAHIAQEVEHFLGKEEVSGSSPDVGSSSFAYATLERQKVSACPCVHFFASSSPFS